ncbi:MAG: chromate efflux transporter [Chloroflexota bacterium]|nr:chromate efflux transporter [Chloroflexota bacterium]
MPTTDSSTGAAQPGSADPSPATSWSSPPVRGALGEVATLFLKLGCIAFGGPAAHIAMMRDEVVRRRKWLTDQQFLDLLGASNLIPGPSSTELAIYLGYTRAGPVGLLLAGVLFILPAMLIVMGFAWAYVQFGSTPPATALLYGVKPVILAVIVQAIYGLLRTAVKRWLLGIGVVIAIGLYFIGLNPLVPLFGIAIGVMLIERRGRLLSGGGPGPPSLAASVLSMLPTLPLLQAAPLAVAAASFSLLTLFLTFLKIGATIYGSGYVLLAFVRDEFVYRLGWLTDQQILDAVAVGQFTPGPVFTTATFIGYILGGVTGAIVATVAIFLPAFVFVAVVYPLVPRLRASGWASAFLDGANAAAIGLMAAVTWQLATSSIVDGLTAGLALVAAVLLIRFKVNSAWLVAGGGLAGLGARLLIR